MKIRTHATLVPAALLAATVTVAPPGRAQEPRDGLGWLERTIGAADAPTPGRGGPGGDFDWLVPAGTTFVFDTVSQVIVGGPDFAPTTSQLCLNGLVEVDDLRVEPGAELRFVGPNPVQVLATGQVEILGLVTVDGLSSPGVVTLNTTNLPEIGAPGTAGGGRGGTGSPEVSQSTVRGGTGFGAFDAPGGGGQGGETGWNTNSLVNDRRGAGGGGGRFAADELTAVGDVDQSLLGLDAETGFSGGPAAYGAENPAAKESPPDGGASGTGPFVDGDPRNDFFGLKIHPVTGRVVRGELPGVWAGAGGGGGGDAARVTDADGIFPNDVFSPAGDEKGSGGGGAGGAIEILAQGRIVFGSLGRISARGGAGGGGESTNFINRVGGGSGGGSGGHVILQSARAIDFRAAVSLPAVIATGGQGGAGQNDAGGAGAGGETTTAQDACPDTAVAGCVLGAIAGAGGDGGPGVVQLHADLVLTPTWATLSDVVRPTPVTRLLPLAVDWALTATPPAAPRAWLDRLSAR